MEFWSFPPAYDCDYMPSSGNQYWFPVRETMDAGERGRQILLRLQQVMDYAYEHSEFYRRKWEDAGIHPEHIRSLEDFERVPVVTKQELRAAQERVQPFGDYLCIPDSEVHHVPWRQDPAGEIHNVVYLGAGIRRGGAGHPL